jgi:hypothetical protein
MERRFLRHGHVGLTNFSTNGLFNNADVEIMNFAKAIYEQNGYEPKQIIMVKRL